MSETEVTRRDRACAKAMAKLYERHPLSEAPEVKDKILRGVLAAIDSGTYDAEIAREIERESCQDG